MKYLESEKKIVRVDYSIFKVLILIVICSVLFFSLVNIVVNIDDYRLYIENECHILRECGIFNYLPFYVCLAIVLCGMWLCIVGNFILLRAIIYRQAYFELRSKEIVLYKKLFKRRVKFDNVEDVFLTSYYLIDYVNIVVVLNGARKIIKIDSFTSNESAMSISRKIINYYGVDCVIS